MQSRLRYVRHRSFDRLRHSHSTMAWLQAQATRLGMTPQAVFEDLLVAESMTSEQIESMTPGLFLSGTLPDGQEGVAYSGALTINGAYEGVVTLDALSGQPTGVIAAVVEDEVVFSGTPTTAGPYSFDVTVRDDSDPEQVATSPQSVTIDPE